MSASPQKDRKQISFPAFVSSFESKGGKVIIQTVMGRSGSMLVHSLFDGHPHILSYPGPINFYDTIAPDIANHQTDWQHSIKETLDAWNAIMKPYNIHKNLGPDGNDELNINNKTIIEEMARATEGLKMDRRTLFLAVHYAVGVSLGRNLEDIRVIYEQEHTTLLTDEQVNCVRQDFANHKFLCITRDPRSNYLSIVNWKKKREQMNMDFWIKQKYTPGFHELMCCDWYVNFLALMNRNQTAFIILRLEDMQAGGAKYVQELVNLLGIQFHESLSTTTFGGYLWGGDSFSTRQTGFRNSAAEEIWRKRLSKVKQAIIEKLLSDEIAALNYRFFFKRPHWANTMAWLLLPFWNRDDSIKSFKYAYYNRMKQEGKACTKVVVQDLKIYVKSIIKICKLLFFKKRNYQHIPDILFSQQK